LLNRQKVQGRLQCSKPPGNNNGKEILQIKLSTSSKYLRSRKLNVIERKCNYNIEKAIS